MSAPPAALVVAGVGSEYRRDDGIGPAAAGEIARLAISGVRVIVSGGDPARLLCAWDGAALAVVIDAVRADPAVPGRIRRHELADLPASGAAASSHGLGLPDAVRLGLALGRMPARLVVFAVEAADLGLGPGLSPPVAAALPALTEVVAAELRRAAGRSARPR